MQTEIVLMCMCVYVCTYLDSWRTIRLDGNTVDDITKKVNNLINEHNKTMTNGLRTQHRYMYKSMYMYVCKLHMYVCM